MKLYYVPRTRALRPRWLLEEIGVPYDLVRLDVAGGENKLPEYRRIHPLGHVPALVDGEVTIFEAAAIVAYLADKFPEAGLAPPVGSRDRALYYQWMFFCLGELEPAVVKISRDAPDLPPERRSASAGEAGRRQFAEIAPVLEAALDGKEFLVGDHLTGADVLVCANLTWGRKFGILDGHPTLEAYVKRLHQRPAYRRAVAD